MPTLKDLADRIHREVDIVDVIGRHVQLTPRGGRHVGLCPFHDDHKPSMYVDPEKGLYHCFVCKAGGDIIRFVERIEGLEFVGALELIATQHGIPFEMYRGVPREAAEQGRKRDDTLREACQIARDHFRDVLKRNAATQAYLDKRLIPPDLIERFELGLAPSGWDGLLNHLASKRFRPQTAVEAGLAIHRPERDSHYDRFRARLMFPIWDALGRPVAFGGRVLPPEPDDSPKYINSPETPIYTKGDVLYAYHIARDAIRERGHAVLCEGYLDVIAAHSARVTEAVASLGTALTDAQAKLLRRLADQVVLLYDADAAGQAATLRGCEVLVRHGLKVLIAPLPEGLDPDDFVREHGPDSLRELVDNAQPALRHLTRWLLRAADGPKDPLERRIWVLDQVAPSIRSNSNEISRDHQVSEVASWVGIDEALVRRHLERSGPRAAQDLHREAQHRKLDRPPAPEQGLLRCLLEQPELADRVRSRRDLLDGLTDPRIRIWIDRLLDEPEPPRESPQRAQDTVERLAAGDDAQDAVLREILLSEEDFSNPEGLLGHILTRLEKETARKRLVQSCQDFAESPDPAAREQNAEQIHQLATVVHPTVENPQQSGRP